MIHPGFDEESIRQEIEYEFIPHMDGTGVHVFVVVIHHRRPHFHRDSELLIPLEGEISINIGRETHRVQAGEFFFINAYEIHSLHKMDAPNALLVLQFNSGFCRHYYPEFSVMNIRRPLISRGSSPALYQELLQGIMGLVRCLGAKEKGYSLEVMGELNHLTCALVRLAAYDQSCLANASRQERARLRLMRISSYIQEHYSGKPSLAELARLEGLETTYLSRLIRESLGLTFREYITWLRLEHAARLVTTTDLRWIDICLESGFSDIRYLNKAFERAFGQSPQRMRSEAKMPPRIRIWKNWNQDIDIEHDVQEIIDVHRDVLTQLAGFQS